MVSYDHPAAVRCDIVNAEAGIVRSDKKKVCLVGYAETSRDQAWYDDPECEIWGVNMLYRFIPRADRWFQIHHDWNDSRKWPLSEAGGSPIDVHQWMRESEIPIYMTQVEPDIPMSVKYPLEDVASGGPQYLTSSIAMMFALALHEGFQTIGLYGIEFVHGTEYEAQKPCLEYWMGRALERGVDVHKPEGCAILHQPHLYGYQDAPDTAGFYNLIRLNARLGQLQKKRDQQQRETDEIKGRLKEADYIYNCLDESGMKDMRARQEKLMRAMQAESDEFYRLDGAVNEIKGLIEILEIHYRGGTVA